MLPGPSWLGSCPGLQATPEPIPASEGEALEIFGYLGVIRKVGGLRKMSVSHQITFVSSFLCWTGG